jgi:hypothetical protein
MRYKFSNRWYRAIWPSRILIRSASSDSIAVPVCGARISNGPKRAADASCSMISSMPKSSTSTLRPCRSTKEFVTASRPHMLAVPGHAWNSPRRGRSDDDHLDVGSQVPVDRTHVACGQAGNEFLEEVTNDFRRLCHYFVVYGRTNPCDTQRAERKLSRRSLTKRSGCSSAGKCPPRGMGV